jgi:preprotein translocase subunit SecY
MSTELLKRCAFTIVALLIYWLGLHIPLPGVDAAAWAQIFAMQSGGMIGQADALSGGALRRLSILSLSIAPYVTAAVILQVLAMVSRRLRALADDERGRARLEQATLVVTVLLATLQSYGIAVGLEGVATVVPEPGFLFRLTTVLTLTAGTLVLAWIASQITARGLGNGIALIIAAGIVNSLPRAIAGLIELSRQGAIDAVALPAAALVTAGLIVLVVVAERSRRRLPVEFAARQAGAQTLPPQSVELPLKLNPAGLVPSYLASLLISIVLLATMFVGLQIEGSEWPDRLRVALAPGTLLNLVVLAALIAFFTLVYTAFVCDPTQMAARLAALGGALPGIPPGEATAAQLDSVISRTAGFGAAYLVVVMLLPDFLTSFFGLPIVLGGTSILVLVCVILDLAAEVRAYLAPAA